MEPEITAANAVAGEEAAPETSATSNAEPTEPAEPDKQLTETQVFARRLKEATEKTRQETLAAAEADKQKAINEANQKAIDAEYDRLYGKEYDIHSKAEYDAEIARQARARQAEEKGYPVELAERLNAVEQKAMTAEERAMTAEQRLALYERREELGKASEVYADRKPKMAEFFKSNRAEIMEIANLMKPDGLTAEEHLDGAVMSVFEDHYEPPKPPTESDVPAEVKKVIGDKAVAAYLETVNKNNRPIEGRGGGIPPTPPASTGDKWKDSENIARAKMRGEPK